MSIIRSSDSVEYDVHGARFASYASPRTGSNDLCAWRVSIPPNSVGALHQPSREEILLVLEGEARVTLGGELFTVSPGDVIVVPPESPFRIDAGSAGATMWVTTRVGLEATMPDGSRFAPPWAR